MSDSRQAANMAREHAGWRSKQPRRQEHGLDGQRNRQGQRRRGDEIRAAEGDDGAAKADRGDGEQRPRTEAEHRRAPREHFRPPARDGQESMTTPAVAMRMAAISAAVTCSPRKTTVNSATWSGSVLV